MPAAPVRVLYCEGNVDGTVGGSYYSLLFLVEGLDRRRFEPLVIFRRETPMRPRFERSGIPVQVIAQPERFALRASSSGICRRYPMLCAPLKWVASAVYLVQLLATVRRLARFLRQERIQLVHLNNSVMRSHDWMLAALWTRTPCITHERGINDAFTPLARWFAPRLKAIVCISAAVRDNLIAGGIARDNLVLIHNGLDPDRVVPSRTDAEVRRAYHIPEGAPVIGLVGNIRAWKGQEVVVRALPAIVARHPEVRCLFIGEASEADKDFVERLRGLIVELGVERHVVFTGYCANVADLLGVLNVAVHASVLPEPFGRVLLEAMAMKKPIVGSRSGAVTEIVVEGVTGCTFTPGSTDELASRVIDVLDAPERTKALGEAGYRRLVDEFHVNRNIDLTMSLYDRTLGHEA